MRLQIVSLYHNESRGKIVVYNEKWVDYGTTVAYRSGAIEVEFVQRRQITSIQAAKLGAVGTLIRSVTPFSIYRYVGAPNEQVNLHAQSTHG